MSGAAMTDAAFEAFVRTHQHMVFATAVRLLGNPAEAEDVAQTVFLKAFERFQEIGTSDGAAGWLRTVTRNLCLNHLSRYRSRWRLFSELRPDDADDEDYAGSLAADQLPPGAALEAAERQAHLEEALRRLPPHQRVPLVLFHFEQASYEEIAVTLNVSVGKVKRDIHRGRESLKKYLAVNDGTR